MYIYKTAVNVGNASDRRGSTGGGTFAEGGEGVDRQPGRRVKVYLTQDLSWGRRIVGEEKLGDAAR